MITAIPKVNADDIAEFLHTVFDHPAIQEKYICFWTPQDRRSRCFQVSDISSAVRYAAERAEDTDVYVRATLLDKAMNGGKRGGAKATTAIVALWADVDVAHDVHKRRDLPPDVDAATELVESFGVVPSVLVESGHGLHAWVLLDEPWLIGSKDDLVRAGDLVQKYQATVRDHARKRGYDLDATHDLARLLRIPGSLNHKQEPLPVRFLHRSGIRYPRNEIEKRLIAGRLTNNHVSDVAVQQRVQTAVRELVTEGACSPEPSDRLKGLMASNRQVRATWERNRGNLKDGTPIRLTRGSRSGGPVLSFLLGISGVAVSLQGSSPRLPQAWAVRRGRIPSNFFGGEPEGSPPIAGLTRRVVHLRRPGGRPPPRGSWGNRLFLEPFPCGQARPRSLTSGGCRTGVDRFPAAGKRSGGML